MLKLTVFLLGMVGLCGTMNTPPDYRNLIGLVMFAIAAAIGGCYERK